MYLGSYKDRQSQRRTRWFKNKYDPEQPGRATPPRHLQERRTEVQTRPTLVDRLTYKAAMNPRKPHIGAKQMAKASFGALLAGPV